MKWTKVMGLALLAVVAAGCTSPVASPVAPVVSVAAGTTLPASRAGTVWGEDDLYVNDLSGSTRLVSYTVTSYVDSPYYAGGKTPAESTNYFTPSSGYISGVLVAYILDGFKTFPAYNSPWGGDIKGLQTTSNGRVVAELYDVADDGEEITASEVHYDSSGNVVFRCTSTFTTYGWKKAESNVHGEKQHEYYYMAPFGSTTMG
jgi:hypothetical protein